MTPQDPIDLLRRAWQTDDDPPTAPTLDEIRRRAARSRGIVRWRNLREYVAGVFVALFFSVNVLRGGFNGLIDVGQALLVVATGYVLYRLWRYGSSPALPAELGVVDALTFYRSALVRQRDLLRNVWWWYLLPFVPGFALTISARAIEQRAPSRAVSAVALLTMVTWVIWWLNQRAAVRLQQMIDALDQPEGRPRPVSAPPGTIERLLMWVLYASAAAGASAAALALLHLDPGGLVPGASALSLPAKRFVWLIVAFAACLMAQVVWWTIRGRKG